LGSPRVKVSGVWYEIRIGIVLPYIVIYEYDKSKDTVTIFRIVHGRRNITAQLLTGTF
jgi:toxin ParE1/3/4